jgi:hypothetical protein
MTVKEIVLQYLKDNGYDGLYYEDQCGCMIYNLMPCGCDKDDCRPGHLIKEETPCFDFVIGEKKE